MATSARSLIVNAFTASQTGQRFGLHIERLEERTLLTGPTAAPDIFFLDQSEVLIATSGPGLDVVEDFNGSDYGLELEGNRFTVENGYIHRTSTQDHNDRDYIRTIRSDLLAVDFRYEVTFTTGDPNSPNLVFIGIGRGERTTGGYHEPTESLNFRIHNPSMADGLVTISNAPVTNLATVGAIPQAGTHRARIEKTGNQVKFEIDAHFNGVFQADLSYLVDDLAATAPFLHQTNTHLFFGSALPEVVFDDFQAQQLPRPGVLANDVDIDGDVLEAILVEGPQNGVLQFQTDGSFVYAPDPGFQGTDQFRYLARAVDGDSEPTVVELHVAPGMDRSIAVDDRYEVLQDSRLEVDPVVRDLHRISLRMETRDVVFSEARGMFYAAVPTSDESGYVQEIDPFSGVHGRRFVVGPGPNQLAVSDDGAFLYVALDDSFAITRVDLTTGIAADPVALSGILSGDDLVAQDIEVFPGQRRAIGVTLGRSANYPPTGSVIFHDLMPVEFPPEAPLANIGNNFSFNDDGSQAIGIVSRLSPRSMNVVNVDGLGWTSTFQVGFGPGNPAGELEWAADRIFFDSGQVFEPTQLDFVGWLPSGSTTADAELGRFFTAVENRIVVSRMDDLEYIHEFQLTDLPEDQLRDVTRFGADGLAVRTTNQDLVTFHSDLLAGDLRARGLIGNDTLLAGMPLEIRIVESTQHGELQLNRDGSFIYEPENGFFGEDRFTYTISDSFAESNEGVVTIDVQSVGDAPTATVNQAGGQSDPTDKAPVNFTVVFSEPVTGFTTNDVVIGGTATGATTTLVTGAGRTYNVTVTGMASGGTVVVSVPAGAAQDGAGNASEASTSTDNDVTYVTTVTVEGGKLIVHGTSGNDDIVFSKGATSNDVEVRLDGASRGIFGPIYQIVAFGGDGNDTIEIDSALALPSKLVGDAGDDTLRGGAGMDLLVGGPGNDALEGRDGNDTLKGKSGHDDLVGGPGDDALFGNAGHDTLQGGAGDDLLRGHSGNDILRGGGGTDDLDGLAGSDVVIGDAGNDSVAGGNGRDLVIGGLGVDDVFGGTSDDILIGGTTDHDDIDSAMWAILNEWKSASSYADRVDHLRGQLGGGLNGSILLRVDQDVDDDGELDDLIGEDGRDWFFDQNDNLLDRVSTNPGKEFVD